MSNPVASPYLVPFDGGFRVTGADTAPPGDAPDENVKLNEVDFPAARNGVAFTRFISGQHILGRNAT